MSAKYNKNLKPLARNLRKFGTKGELALMKPRQLFGARPPLAANAVMKNG